MPVNAKHSDYVRMLPRWQRCRDAADGQDAVHDAGEKYLPKLRDQTKEDYEAYKGRAVFFNATWRTISGLLGMVFRKPPIVEVPDEAKPLLDDVTMEGVPFQVFAMGVLEEALKTGRVGLLVDYPTAEPGQTLADARAANLRPTMNYYHAEDCINWRCERVNNVWVLTLVVLRETQEVKKDDYASTKRDTFRELALVDGKYRVRLFYMDGETQVQIGGDVFPIMRGANLTFIPFLFLSADDTTSEIDEPPLVDLVNVNMSHYKTTADLEHGAHFTGLPTPWVAGAKPDNPNEKWYIGSQAAWMFADPQAKAGFLEFSGTGLKALADLLDDKEQQMAVLGARMLEPQKRMTETAEAQSILRKGEESLLSSIAGSVSLGLTKVMLWFCDWASAAPVVADDVDVELNDEFFVQPMTDKMLTALVAGWQSSAYSFDTLFANLQRGEIIDEDVTADEEKAKIAASPPVLSGQNVDPVTGLPLPPQKLPKPRLKGKVTTPDGTEYNIGGDAGQ